MLELKMNTSADMTRDRGKRELFRPLLCGLRSKTCLLVSAICLLLTAVIVATAGSPDDERPTSSRDLFSTGEILRLTIHLNESGQAELRLHPRSYVRGIVTEIVKAEEEAWERGSVGASKRGSVTNVFHNLGIHLKGNYGTFQAFEKKPSLTLNFDKFVPGQKFHGLDKVHVNNSAQDSSFISEVLCREMFQAGGVPVARAFHARVELNGRDAGLYVLVEGYNKTFLKRYFSDASGHLYDSEFVHDITEPLKSSASGGPPDRSDLERLAAAWNEPNPELRLAKLAKVLDLERFYSFLALEMLTCHFDGYARGINNYWVYHDPGSGKMVFIPHGMDQMFFNPQGSLFPELKGIVAQAVLSTAEGRSRFRERCTLLFTNLFPALSNRVEELRARIRPELATMGKDAIVHHDRVVGYLQGRIRQRVEHLRRHLLATPPNLTSLIPGRETLLTNWLSSVEQGKAAFDEKTPKNGGTILQVRLEPLDKPAVAMWELRALLPKGQYRVSARVAAEQPIFRGAECPVTLKLWGGQDLQSESLRKDAENLDLTRTFLIASDRPEEILLQCEVQSAEEPVVFQLGSVILTRIE
jgi:spore coat protein H